MMRNWLILIFSFVMLFWACEKPKTYSPIPHIEYISSETRLSQDELGNSIEEIDLVFAFEDGDGDLGLLKSQMDADSLHNIFISLLEKKKGEWLKNSDFNGLYRFSNISKTQTNNPLLKGTITCNILISSSLNLMDICKLEFYITDREGHKSNKVQSDDIILKSNL